MVNRKKYSRILVALLVFFISYGVLGQESDIPDYRSTKENVLKMGEKDLRADVVTFTRAGIEEQMGKTSLEVIHPDYYNDKQMYFVGNNVKVTITKGIFNPSLHRLQYFEDKHLVKIDKKPFYGSFARVPQSTIESITVLQNNDTINIPATAFSDLYNPAFTYKDATGTTRSLSGVYFSADKRKIYIYLFNKAPSGSYEVTWILQDKKYLRRVVDFKLYE